MKYALTLLVLLATAGGAFHAGAQQSTPPKKTPPTINLEIAGKKLWLRGKDDVWPKLDENQKHFVENYITTVNSNSLIQVRSLVAEESLVCIDKLPQKMVEQQFSGLLGKQIKGEYTLLFEPFVQKFDPQFDAQQKVWFADPIKHTHTFGIGYLENGEFPSLAHYKLVNKGINYFIVLPCPTKTNVENFEMEEKKAATFFDMLKQALAALSQAQVDQLRKMASQNAPVEVLAMEYSKMHPQYDRYALAIGDYFVKDWRESEKPKTIASAKEGASKKVQEATKEESQAATSETPSASTTPVTSVEASPYKRLHMALILALIFAAGILLLRVIKPKKPNS